MNDQLPERLLIPFKRSRRAILEILDSDVNQGIRNNHWLMMDIVERLFDVITLYDTAWFKKNTDFFISSLVIGSTEAKLPVPFTANIRKELMRELNYLYLEVMEIVDHLGLTKVSREFLVGSETTVKQINVVPYILNDGCYLPRDKLTLKRV